MRQFPESKNINYIQAVKLQKEKGKKGAIEVLYKHNGRVLECTRSNFFIVKKGVLITPAKDILKGLTRDKTIQLAKKAKFKVEEREVAEKEVFNADEAFITTTSKKILPIVKIDSQKIGSGQPGPITKELMKLFDDCAKNY
ncbi:MAG: aminotransferase class IV [Candidatus Vogelbacteria bacterium]|nr:aminotransferase class IV [Candidatus Vogelbacteria bacterium]